MDESNVQMMQQLAHAAGAQQKQISGRTPSAVTGALSEDTLVLTLHNALTPAEEALAQRAAGAAQVEEFHRQLFETSSASMLEEIRRVTGRDVSESALEVVRDTGAVIHSFPSGTLVHVYLLSQIRDGSGHIDRTAIDETNDERLPPNLNEKKPGP